MNNTNNITKEQKIGLAVLIIVILGLIYFNTTNKEAVNNEEIVPNVEENLTVDENSVEGTEEKASEVEEAKGPTLKEKFSLALENGSKAFQAKDHDKAIEYYNQALGYIDSDLAYIRIFAVYNDQNNIDKARIAIESAIRLNGSMTDYWITKLVFLDEKTEVSFADLKSIYNEGFAKADPRTKINLVTSFAIIAEKNYQKAEAIATWEKAIQIYPQNKIIYQAEIDRLKAL